MDRSALSPCKSFICFWKNKHLVYNETYLFEQVVCLALLDAIMQIIFQFVHYAVDLTSDSEVVSGRDTRIEVTI